MGLIMLQNTDFSILITDFIIKATNYIHFEFPFLLISYDSD